MAVTTTMQPVASEHAAEISRRRLPIGFMNWGHALDHFLLPIFPRLRPFFAAGGGDRRPLGPPQPDVRVLYRLRRIADRRRFRAVASRAGASAVFARRV